MVNFLLKGEHESESLAPNKWSRGNLFVRIDEGFNRGFEGVRTLYVAKLEWALKHARFVAVVSLGVVVVSLFLLVPFLGENFFPLVMRVNFDCTCERR